MCIRDSCVRPWPCGRSRPCARKRARRAASPGSHANPGEVEEGPVSMSSSPESSEEKISKAS
eukprot:4708191-Alexandrium_andersonii.AAC.1